MDRGVTPKPAADSQSELEAIYHQVLLPAHSDWFFKQQTCGLIGDRLPIYFHHYDACCSQTLQRMVASFAEGDFYIGASVNPRTRWLGRGQTDEREAMVGHYAKWAAMVMVAFTAEGPRLEASLIKFALRLFGDRCANRVADPRGQTKRRHFSLYAKDSHSWTSSSNLVTAPALLRLQSQLLSQRLQTQLLSQLQCQ